jgi:large subunit ribosomal protein L31
MKKDIHPEYYPEAKVVCSCGNTWVTGSTKESIRTDVCSACHPFFTGEQRIVDTAGQVDRFMRRMEQYDTFRTQEEKRTQEIAKKELASILNQQIAALDLSDRVHKALLDANVVTIRDIVDKLQEDDKQLLAIEGFGPKALEEVKEKLAEEGLL